MKIYFVKYEKSIKENWKMQFKVHQKTSRKGVYIQLLYVLKNIS